MDKAAYYKEQIYKEAFLNKKLNKEQKLEIKKVKKENIKKQLKSLGAGIGLSAVSTGAAMDLIGPELFNIKSKNTVDPEQMKETLRDFMRNEKMEGKFNIKSEGFAGGKFVGPHFHPGEGYIDVGGMKSYKRNADFVVAHELGHAQDFLKHPRISNALAYARIGGPAAAGIAGLALASTKLRDKIRSLDKGKKDGKFNKLVNFYEKHPILSTGGLAAAAYLPLELSANARALKILKRKYGLGSALKKSLSPAVSNTASYASTGLLGGVGSAMLMNHADKRKKIKDIKKGK